jgi:sodium/bile acid cotransporter 7
MRWVAAVVIMLVGMGCGGAPEYADDAEKLATIASTYAGFKERMFPDVKEVTVEALHANMEKYVLVDVRTEGERVISMLPGAISRDTYDADREAYAGKPVVAYCTIGARSGRFTAELTAEGVEAYNLPGSVLAWSHAGYSFVDEGAETRQVHVNSSKWNMLAGGYEGVW